MFIFNLADYIPIIISDYGVAVYVILFLVIFCETGLVITPFLPGDSIIFACGAIFASLKMDVFILGIVFITAAILGDTVNYLIGRKIGLKVLKKHKNIIKARHINSAEKFYKKYGGKAIVLSRFIPIIRTFAPFVAGISKMDIKKFLLFNILGGMIWIALFLTGGFLFGNLPLVKDNFSVVEISIILISILPVLIEWFRHNLKLKKVKKKGLETIDLYISK